MKNAAVVDALSQRFPEHTFRISDLPWTPKKIYADGQSLNIQYTVSDVEAALLSQSLQADCEAALLDALLIEVERALAARETNACSHR